MTFRATITASALADALAPLSAVVDEAKLQLNTSGVRARAVDPANVAMIDLQVDADAFDAYHAGDDGTTIGVQLDKLEDAIGFADSDAPVEISVDADRGQLDIETGGLELSLALIDPDQIRQEPDIPDLDLPATYVFKGRALARATKAADLCADYITIEAAADDAVAFAADGDADSVRDELNGDRLLSGRCTDAGAASMFSLDYVSSLARPIASDTDVSLLVGDALPLQAKYSPSGGDTHVTAVLAPRIQGS